MPLYTFECPAGHQWGEIRGLAEDAQVSEGRCQVCAQAEGPAASAEDAEQRGPRGRKVPSQVSRPQMGRGATPTFYLNRDTK